MWSDNNNNGTSNTFRTMMLHITACNTKAIEAMNNATFLCRLSYFWRGHNRHDTVANKYKGIG
jgi:hypothetical protein